MVPTKIFLKSCSSQFLQYQCDSLERKKDFYNIRATHRLFLSLNVLPFIVRHLLTNVHDGPAAAWPRRSDLDRGQEGLVLLVLLQPDFTP